VGFFTSTVEDASILLNAISDVETEKLQQPPKLGVPDKYFKENADPEVSEEFTYTVRKLGENGTEIRRVTLPKSFDYAHSTHRVIMSAEAAAVHEPLFLRHFGDYRPYLRGQIASGLLLSSSTYLRALRVQAIYRKEMLGIFRECDAIATPAATSVAPRGLEWTGDPAFNSIWSLAGFPTITIPVGLTEGGLPVGLQLAAAPNQESKLLGIASFCERVLRFHSYPPI
jgi:Asp-tRNA(Asn)/Glu-tRNA(Gln) amidotransferase A subunit family amidase